MNPLQTSGYFIYLQFYVLKSVLSAHTNSNFLPMKYYTIFYNINAVCLLCGTNCVFKYNPTYFSSLNRQSLAAEARFRYLVSPWDIRGG
jgi:hypothetical protein